MKVKLFAMYLPQFHIIKENSEFWGEGFTDWVGVKKSTPLFKNHLQPRVPLDNNYYDLSEVDNVKWQAKIAKEHGIDGFAIYHYWFNNEKNLLTKPSEIILNNKDIDINYFFAWDNGSWKRTWSKIQGNDWAPDQDSKIDKTGPQVLVEYILGKEEDWENHFNYLLPFFKDDRYEKKDNKPVFMIYNFSNDIDKMTDYWNELCKKNGFEGIYMIYRYDVKYNIPNDKIKYIYEPLNSGWGGFLTRAVSKIKRTIGFTPKLKKYDYDKIWKKIIKNASKSDSNTYNGCFVNYDDTPRRGLKGKVVLNSDAEKFGKYLQKLIDIIQKENKEYLFITAWNEWGEGAFLEPDEKYKYEYLEQIKKCRKD